MVAFLRESSALSDWSVSRVVDDVQVHLHVHEENILQRGDRVPWPSSFCHQMMSGASPIVRDSAADPDYAHLPMAQRIRAYAGVPIDDGTGQVFGVLCGVDPWPVEAVQVVDLDLLRFSSRMLTHQLKASRLLDGADADADEARTSALTDELTALLNRRGWNRAVVEAERALDAYGDTVHVAIVDADGLKSINDTQGHLAGDAVLQQMADCLGRAAGGEGVVARLSGDEFGLLLVGQHGPGFGLVLDKVSDELRGAGVEASVGWSAAAVETGGVSGALGRADAAMYEDKRRRQASR
ncbi:GGDEF domain-containing protein [Solicola sp. PLA-1-18]|uniref:GGDEF domain-containing protein n=1 Tax=Solicola sp. PLA-1-18 TaxID=3380532 RepID=UPI003B7BB18A